MKATVDLGAIREIVHDALDKDMAATASFFADKLVSFSGQPKDVLLHARCLHLRQQHRAAYHILEQHALTDYDCEFRFLAAKCLFRLKEYEDALTLLEHATKEPYDPVVSHSSLAETESSGGININAAMCTLAGEIHEHLDNHQKAKLCYIQALSIDGRCFDSFEKLVDKFMLTEKEEEKLLRAIERQKASSAWMCTIYRARAGGCSRRKQDEDAAYSVSLLEGCEFDIIDSKASSGSQTQQAFQSTSAIKTRSNQVRALRENGDVITAKAQYLYDRGEYTSCLHVTSNLIQKYPYNMAIYNVHIASMLELERKNDLFIVAHRLVEDYPEMGLPWHAVGCYYTCIKQHDQARRFFSKATSLDPTFAPAWLGFGNSFAAQDESDQAMAAYRRAARLFPASHLPLLAIGMEYQKANNLPLAREFLEQAFELAPDDPTVRNEMGIVMYRDGQYMEAEEWFSAAVEKLKEQKRLTNAWEATVTNLGHCLRKLKRLDEAIDWYEVSLSLKPKSAHILSAIGFAYHLKGELGTAVDYYHASQGYRPYDAFTTEMLSEALRDESYSFFPEF